jgi:hypothetical protein
MIGTNFADKHAGTLIKLILLQYGKESFAQRLRGFWGVADEVCGVLNRLPDEWRAPA